MRAHHLQDTALRYFLEVVRSGSLAVASERLHVAASAISRQISGLEQALDTVLFERQPRGMVPTPAGEILAAHARRSSMDADRVLEDLDALRGARQGGAQHRGKTVPFTAKAKTAAQTQSGGFRTPW